ncbi:hypothetical protein [Lysobacter sp. CA199]|uniref:hypothetical protein n=1 Tax=Lysobacter sp. CA199 TaxID=3455608 RepID=UPI003F8D7277
MHQRSARRRRFTAIAPCDHPRPTSAARAMQGWNYRSSGADLMLFYEPVERLALLTFDWT